jgi:hypothetical protein
MIYVDDVGIHDGPFHGAPSRPDDFEPKRLSFRVSSTPEARTASTRFPRNATRPA